MANNEIKVVATVDDRLTPGLSKMEQSVQKFGFSADGMLSKLARSFSATDLAVGALVASIAKAQQIINTTAKAYLSQAESMDAVVLRYKELNEAIAENDKQIGGLTGTWALFWKENEKRLSDFLSDLAAIQALVPGFVPGFGMSMRTPEPRALPVGSGSGVGSRSGAGSGYDGPFADAATREEMERKWRNSQPQGVPSWVYADPRIDRANARNSRDRAGRRRAGVDDIPEPSPVDFGQFDDPNQKIQEEFEKMYQIALEKTLLVNQAFQGMFSIILSGSRDMGEQLKKYFRDLVSSILSQLAAKAAANAIGSAFPGLGLVVSSNQTVAVGPAALNSERALNSYNSARGR